MNRLLDGPHIVIRPTIVQDTWLSSSLDRIESAVRERGGIVLGEDIEGDLPVEARCRLCDVRPKEPCEPEHLYTAYLKEVGAAIGPVTLRNAQRWMLGHLLWKHGIDGVAASYEVRSGTERWVA